MYRIEIKDENGDWLALPDIEFSSSEDAQSGIEDLRAVKFAKGEMRVVEVEL